MKLMDNKKPGESLKEGGTVPPQLEAIQLKRLMAEAGVRRGGGRGNGKLVGPFGLTTGCWVSLLSSNPVLMHSKQRCSFRGSITGNQDSFWHPGLWPEQNRRHFT